MVWSGWWRSPIRWTRKRRFWAWMRAGERENVFWIGGEKTSGMEKFAYFGEKILSLHTELKRGLGMNEKD